MTAKEIMKKLENAGCARETYYDDLFCKTVCQVRIPFSREAEIVNLIGCKFTSGTSDLHNYRLSTDSIEFFIHAC